MDPRLNFEFIMLKTMKFRTTLTIFHLSLSLIEHVKIRKFSKNSLTIQGV